MSATRIYQALPFAVHTVVRLDDQASHHLARVLRAQLGDQVTLFNGKGGEYHAIITQIDKKGIAVEISNFSPREAESPVTIHLAQGIARGEKMDFIVQKAVELGVSKIIPLITERCNVRLDNEREAKRLQHWQSVIISACEQSGRNSLPEILAPQSLKAWLPNVQTDLNLVLSPHVANKLPSNTPATYTSITLLIGPEGGLSEPEIQAAAAHGFLPLNLGPRVLRTETATLAAMTVCQCLYGDMRDV